MAELANLSYRKLAWCATWYLREETLKAVTAQLVNFQHRQPLAAAWGTGTLSSSDGQRFPVTVKARNATALPRYFGYGRGLTHNTWTSDQHALYGGKPIPTTARDATYVLDEILVPPPSSLMRPATSGSFVHLGGALQQCHCQVTCTCAKPWHGHVKPDHAMLRSSHVEATCLARVLGVPRG
jgi:hypothetical protein